MKTVTLEVKVTVADYWEAETVADIIDEAIQEKTRWAKTVKVTDEEKSDEAREGRSDPVGGPRAGD